MRTLSEVEAKLRRASEDIAIEDQDYSDLISFEAINHSSHLTSRAEFASGKVVRLRSDQDGDSLR